MIHAPRSLCRAARALRRDEGGSMIVFAMFLMIMMLMVGGMSVDLMRFESARSRLQATCDRGVLAAANLDQALDAEAVVRDYFGKAGLLQEVTSISVTETINSRSVTATAEMDLDTYFMDLVGVGSLTAPADCTATEAVNDIEVVLVLDVSGSMASNNRLVNLQAAARDFVDVVLANDTQNRISIGIVPFNGQVNLGPVLRPWYTGISDLVTTPAGVNCVDLPSGVYGTQSIARNLAMPATQYVDTFTSADRTNVWRAPTAMWDNPTTHGTNVQTNIWCPSTSTPTANRNFVLLPTRDVPTLKAQINGLYAIGATSINAGMRWGMTLLDPASQPMFANFISARHIPSFFAGRPYAFGRADTMKVIVLMTDGDHFAEERVNPNFRGPILSDIYRSTADGNLSIFHPSKVNRTGTGATLAANVAASRPFWIPHLSAWQARPWNGAAPNPSNMPYAEGDLRRRDNNGDGVCNNADDVPGRGTLKANEACWFNASQQTWGQIWSSVRMQWVAWQLYGRALGTSTTSRNDEADDQMDRFRTLTPVATMNTQLQQMCTRARGQNVIVFGIAFEAPAGGQTQIYNCASSPSHYYNSQGLQIRQDFRAIAAQISALRLAQ